jgi:two-component system, OmpR family, response regulator
MAMSGGGFLQQDRTRFHRLPLQEPVLILRVFVVDDMSDMRSLLIDVFESAGCFRIVGTAANEGEARAWLESHPAHWDLAIVDLVLSGGSGFGVVTRAKETHADGCVVVLSSFVSGAVEKHCLRLGADVVFSKAHTPEFLGWVQRVAGTESVVFAQPQQTL